MALRAIRTPDNEGVRTKYNTVIARLQATVAKYKDIFPQLKAVEKFLDVTLPEANSDEAYVKRLEELCAYLYELSVNSYVIRHLHHDLCEDVEAVKAGTFPLGEQEHYLDLPR